MSDFIQGAPDSTGKKVAATLLNDGVQDIYLQEINISDSSTVGAKAKVINTEPVGSEYGLTVRQVGVASTAELLSQEPQFPGYEKFDPSITSQLLVDTGGSLVTRSAVLTDEGSLRANFANSSIAVSVGTVTISGSTVTGSFAAVDVRPGEYFKLDADANTSWNQIASVTNTTLELVATYSGGSSGAASRSILKLAVGATTGSSAVVSAGEVTVTVGTGTGTASLSRFVDYGPMVMEAVCTIPAAASAQYKKYIGFQENVDDPSAARWFARFLIETTTTSFKCQTGRNPTAAPNSNEIESTTHTPTLTLTAGASTYRRFRIEILSDRVLFYVNDEIVATHRTTVPLQSDVMAAGIYLQATAGPTSDTIKCNSFSVNNHNKLEIGYMSSAEKLSTDSAPMETRNYTQAGVITINTDLMIIDCAKFRSVSIQCAAMGTTGVVTPSFSNDGTNFVNVSLMTTAGVAAGTFNAAGLWTTKVYGRYLRLRLTTATTAGTTTLIVNGYNVDVGQAQVQPVSGTVAVSSATLASNQVITPVPQAGQGASTYHTLVSAATTNATSVKGSAGVINSFMVANSSATGRWLKVYNKATAGVPGTDVPVLNFWLKPSDNTSIPTGPFGIRLSTGISYAITANQATNDATVIAAGDCVVSIVYT